MRAINFVALHQADVLQPRCDRLNRFDEVHEHGEIGQHELGPTQPILVRGVKDVGYSGEVTKFLPAVVAIEQIDCHVSNAVCLLSAAPRQTDDVPITQDREMFHEIAANDSVSSGDQRDFVLGAHRFSSGNELCRPGWAGWRVGRARQGWFSKPVVRPPLSKILAIEYLLRQMGCSRTRLAALTLIISTLASNDSIEYHRLCVLIPVCPSKDDRSKTRLNSKFLNEF